MASHPQPCTICEQIGQIKRGEHLSAIMELNTGYVVLGDNQYFHGYTLFLCKQKAADLEDLPLDFRLKFLEEMAMVSEGVANVVRPHKMNIESLGNMVPHLHWHLFPRQLEEKNPTKPVWLVMPEGEEAKKYAFNSARDDELMQQIRWEILNLAK